MTRRLLLPMLCLLAAGCGQMGPLYFDEAPPADQLPPSLKDGAARRDAAVPPATVPAASPAPVAPDTEAATETGKAVP